MAGSPAHLGDDREEKHPPACLGSAGRASSLPARGPLDSSSGFLPSSAHFREQTWWLQGSFGSFSIQVKQGRDGTGGEPEALAVTVVPAGLVWTRLSGSG